MINIYHKKLAEKFKKKNKNRLQELIKIRNKSQKIYFKYYTLLITQDL